MRLGSLAFGFGLVVALALPADAAPWSSFRDPTGHYSVDLPTASFRQDPSGHASHVTFGEAMGDAIIDVYSGRNLKRLSPAQFIMVLSTEPRIRDITYSARGRRWFAISGHYVRESAASADLIYYAKFAFSKDLSEFAAIEISYSTDEKHRMDGVVTHLEKSLKLTHG